MAGSIDNGVGQYQGHGFHHTLPGGKSSGEITVTDTAIQFQCEASMQTFAIEGAEFSLGGASDRLVFIKHSDHPDWSFFTSDRTILNDACLQNNQSIAQQLAKAKQTRWFNHSLLLAVIGLVVLLPVLFISNIDTLTGVAAKQVPADWEYNLGQAVYAQYKISQRLMSEQITEEVLIPVVKPLLMALESAASDQMQGAPRFTPQIAIVDDPEINAFALPGGFVVINSGLILAADSAEEVLGVLAHELSHVSEQHSIRNIISAASVYLTVDLLLGDVTGLAALIADAAPLLLHQQFSRGFEHDADRKGYELLTRANIDPLGLTRFFEKIIQQRKEQLDKVEDDTARELMAVAEGLFSTHPATEERIEYIQSLAKDNRGPYVDLALSFAELKKSVKDFVVTEGDRN